MNRFSTNYGSHFYPYERYRWLHIALVESLVWIVGIVKHNYPLMLIRSPNGTGVSLLPMATQMVGTSKGNGCMGTQ